MGFIGTVADYTDTEGFRANVRRSRKFGFEAASVIHPSGIPIVNEEFTPTDEEVDHARRVVEAYAEAEKQGLGAIKVDGKRAHQRVRDGEQVELKARPVTVHELVVGEQRVVGEHLDVDLSVRCSSGTYGRAIARDVGTALGVGGHLTALRRTAVGPYDLGAARTLEQLEEDPSVLPVAEAARAAFASIDLDEDEAGSVRVGRALERDLDGLTALFDPSGEFLALYEPRGEVARAVAVFV